jgi:HAE1 family hydrophobic/amphiphilic exporter-1
LRWRFTTLCVFFATVALSGYLFVIILKAFSATDVGLITGTLPKADRISSSKCRVSSPRSNDHPERSAVASSHGDRRWRQRLNNGRMFITLKPRDDPRRQCAADYCDCARSSESWKAAACSCKLRRMSLGGRATRTQFEYTLQDAN